MLAGAHFPSPPFVTPDVIVSELRQLPSAPKVLPRLKRLLLDSNTSIDEIVRLVRVDPSLALRVLQVANSPYFSRGERCISVEDAVKRVGFDHVYELVAYAVASQVLVQPLAVYRLAAEDLWQRSVTCALAADLVAGAVGEDQQAAYTAGLLHAVGMVAIDDWTGRHRRGLRLVWSDAMQEYAESEKRQLGCHQGEVGASLLRSWDFPGEVWLPMQWQYAPAQAPFQPQLAAILYVAKWLRALCLHGTVTPAIPAPPILRSLRLSPERLRALAPELRRRLQHVRDLVETGPADVAA